MWQAGVPSNGCIRMHLAGQLSKARGADDERCTDLKLLHFGPDVWKIAKHVPSGPGSHRRDDPSAVSASGMAPLRSDRREETLIDLLQGFADTYMCSRAYSHLVV